MTEIDVRRPETYAFTDEAVLYAATQLVDYEAQLFAPYGTENKFQRDMIDLDRSRQAEADKFDSVYFGHTRKLSPVLYRALRDGYNPTEEQIEVSAGHDFMWDEIGELNYEHPDIARLLDQYGYRGEKAPVHADFVGAYYIPRDMMRSILATLYMRGKEYREWGWNYPSWGESGNPADFLEEALLRFKPGTKSAEQIAASAAILAGRLGYEASKELVTVAQDLIDNDRRLSEQEA